MRQSFTRKMISLGASALLGLLTTVNADSGMVPGGFEIVQPDSQASAMMMALIDQDNVMIIDKTENNRAQFNNGKPVWGTAISLTDYSVTALEMNTNPFCAAGAQLGNGTWIVVGGNHAIGYGGGSLGNVLPQNGPYQDYDGWKAVRIMEPQTNASNLNWIDEQNAMAEERWYPGIEVMTDGSALIIGGATGGGYINRNTPNVDPAYEGGGATPSWEFFPSRGNAPTVMTFMNVTSGLNLYPHTYMMPSGKLFMQANYSTALWNITANNETIAYDWLDNMPDNIVRVYPASGAVAMLPLTPENNYTPTILFCGGSLMADDSYWGNYTGPGTNMYLQPAQTDCSSITPEDSEGNLVNTHYVHEENLPEPRSMGQFIHLPTGQMVIVNGANNGTAGYTNATWNLINGVNFEGVSQGPTYKPIMYDPSLPMGNRLTDAGFGSSTIARLYHSSAILVPDGSVMIGGSNPHQDVSLDMPLGTTPEAFNTTYAIEKWYPLYYFEERPKPQGLPGNLMYGGNTWNFTMDATYMGSSANYKANNTKVMVIRPGFSTHAMNMGQRSLQLQHTYTVNGDGSVTYEVMPMPTNQNIFVQGPALLFVTIDGIPSIGKYIQIGTQTFGAAAIPNTITSGAQPPQLAAAVNNPNFNATPGGSGDLGAIIGGSVGGGVLLLALLGLLVFCCCRRRRNNRNRALLNKTPKAQNEGAIYGVSGYAPGGSINSQYRSVGQHDPALNSPRFQAQNLPFDQRSQRSIPSMASQKLLSAPQTPYDGQDIAMTTTPSAGAMYASPHTSQAFSYPYAASPQPYAPSPQPYASSQRAFSPAPQQRAYSPAPQQRAYSPAPQQYGASPQPHSSGDQWTQYS